MAAVKRYLQRWALSCGCEAEIEPAGFRLAWVIVKRCADHPTGAVPVEAMALLEPTEETGGG